MSKENGDVKPDVQRDGATMEIGIKMQDGSEVKFRVKGHTPFQKVFSAWANKKGVQASGYRFLDPQGLHIKPEDTPAGHGCEDGDTIDAMVEQLGG